MTTAEIARLLTEALEAKARDEASAAQLVMIGVDYVSAPQPGAIAANISRKTRTLLFLEAELRTSDNTLVARASSVHAIA
jgi:acyl-coenzyme A thioesterase PaaI-like protein